MSKAIKNSEDSVYPDPITKFVYGLLGIVPAGEVTKLLSWATNELHEDFSDKLLARYAHELVEELHNAVKPKLEQDLVSAFEDSTIELEDWTPSKIKPVSNVSALETTLDKAIEDGMFIENNKPIDPEASAVQAKVAIKDLVANGHLTQEKAEQMGADIVDAMKPSEVPQIKAIEMVKNIKEEDKINPSDLENMVEFAMASSLTAIPLNPDDPNVTIMPLTNAEPTVSEQETEVSTSSVSFSDLGEVHTEHTQSILDRAKDGLGQMGPTTELLKKAGLSSDTEKNESDEKITSPESGNIAEYNRQQREKLQQKILSNLPVADSNKTTKEAEAEPDEDWIAIWDMPY